jgi:hypothetical protein
VAPALVSRRRADAPAPPASPKQAQAFATLHGARPQARLQAVSPWQEPAAAPEEQADASEV